MIALCLVCIEIYRFYVGLKGFGNSDLVNEPRREDKHNERNLW